MGMRERKGEGERGSERARARGRERGTKGGREEGGDIETALNKAELLTAKSSETTSKLYQNFHPVKRVKIDPLFFIRAGTTD